MKQLLITINLFISLSTQAQNTEKKVNLIEQLEIKLEISKIKHDIGYLLLDSEEDVNKNRLLDLLNFKL